MRCTRYCQQRRVDWSTSSRAAFGRAAFRRRAGDLFTPIRRLEAGAPADEPHFCRADVEGSDKRHRCWSLLQHWRAPHRNSRVASRRRRRCDVSARPDRLVFAETERSGMTGRRQPRNIGPCPRVSKLAATSMQISKGHLLSEARNTKRQYLSVSLPKSVLGKMGQPQLARSSLRTQTSPA